MKVKTVTIDADVEAVIRAATLNGNNLTLNSQLPPPMYKKTMKVLELIGFKWNRGQKCHIGEGDSADRLREALDDGKVVDEKQTYQFFETPERLAGRMASLAGIKCGDRVLEPSAGRGSIINAIFALQDAPSVVFAVELDPKNVHWLKAVDAEINQAPPQKTICVTEGNFLEHQDQYDRIVMNPPFTQDQAVKHVKHAYDLLLPGGRLVSIMDKGWLFGSSRIRSEFRDWYEGMQNEGLASIPEVLPAGTFKDSGTTIETVLVILQKPLSKEQAA